MVIQKHWYVNVLWRDLKGYLLASAIAHARIAMDKWNMPSCILHTFSQRPYWPAAMIHYPMNKPLSCSMFVHMRGNLFLCFLSTCHLRVSFVCIIHKAGHDMSERRDKYNEISLSLKRALGLIDWFVSQLYISGMASGRHLDSAVAHFPLLTLALIWDPIKSGD